MLSTLSCSTASLATLTRLAGSDSSGRHGRQVVVILNLHKHFLHIAVQRESAGTAG